MMFSLTINGSGFLRRLLNTYNWQKESLQGTEGGACLPGLNILYSGVAHPPLNIFSQFLDRARRDFDVMLEGIRRFEAEKLLYNSVGQPDHSRESESNLVSLWIGGESEEKGLRESERSGSEKKSLDATRQSEEKLVWGREYLEASPAKPATAETSFDSARKSRGLTLDITID